MQCLWRRSSHDDTDAEAYFIEQVAARATPAILALNKIDLVPKPRLLELIDRWSLIHGFDAVVLIAAVKGTQVEALIDAMVKVLPTGTAPLSAR